ncbi:unnamed protein product [Staurois parvus]|uniref:Uncharacterized protein n=1 Tax=Staurois parvus TaxID=386267 RepID=A0ABN9BPB9_9NEOB|nr:unnamed protein product [Staurois parvus]
MWQNFYKRERPYSTPKSSHWREAISVF